MSAARQWQIIESANAADANGVNAAGSGLIARGNAFAGVVLESFSQPSREEIRRTKISIASMISLQMVMHVREKKTTPM